MVEPHSRSVEPFCISGMRSCEVTGTSLTASAGAGGFGSLRMRPTTAGIRSFEYPTTWRLLSQQENGTENSRWPGPMVAVREIFSSVGRPDDSARAAKARDRRKGSGGGVSWAQCAAHGARDVPATVNP
jgi:hypothetical protein